MRIEKRQVEGQPLTVIVEYPEWNNSVQSLIGKIEKMDLSFVGRSDDRSVSIGISDIYYIENWTMAFDFKIMLGTIRYGFVNKNAY